MSGVGITGQIKPLNGGTFSVFEDTDGYGGFRCVPDLTARDAIPLTGLFRKVGMVVTDQSTGLDWQLVGGTANANWKRYTGAGFFSTYYVDPAFTGTSTGSQSNPYKTVAAAFAAALALGIASGIVFLPPNTTLTENIVFPVAGGNWEVSGQGQFGYITTLINGTVDITGNATCRRAIANLNVLGAITGNANHGGTASRFRLTNAGANSTLTLTATGGSFWRTGFAGSGPPGLVGLGGFCAGNVAIAGTIDASFWSFIGTCTQSVGGGTFFCTSHNAGFITNGAGSVSVKFYNVDFAGATNFNASSGSMLVALDGASAANLYARGSTTTGTVTLSTLIGNTSVRQTTNDNVATTFFAQGYPQSLTRVSATLTLLVPGTAGAAVLNVLYTDLAGIARTKAVTGALNVAGVAGDESTGQLVFSQNGAIGLQYSVTGIVTPGALSYSIGLSAHLEN